MKYDATTLQPKKTILTYLTVDMLTVQYLWSQQITTVKKKEIKCKKESKESYKESNKEDYPLHGSKLTNRDFYDYFTYEAVVFRFCQTFCVR